MLRTLNLRVRFRPHLAKSYNERYGETAPRSGLSGIPRSLWDWSEHARTHAHASVSATRSYSRLNDREHTRISYVYRQAVSYVGSSCVQPKLPTR